MRDWSTGYSSKDVNTLLDMAKDSPWFQQRRSQCEILFVLRGQRLEVGGFTRQFSPAPNPTDIHVDEVQGTIVADPTAMQF